MTKLKLTFQNGESLSVNKGTKIYEIVKDIKSENNLPIVLGRVNGRCRELGDSINEDAEVGIIDISEKIGLDTYVRTLQFILIKAIYDLYPNSQIYIEHSLSKGIFGEVYKEEVLDQADIELIKKRMNEIIDQNIIIKKVKVKKDEAVKLFKQYNMEDKIRLLNYLDKDIVKLYEIDGRYDYFYGTMAYSTGAVKFFDLKLYDTGFVLIYPDEAKPHELNEYKEQPKLAKIFYETESWAKILDVADVGSLNEKVNSKNIVDIIRVAEALHEKKIANIADLIIEKKEVKIVLVAGPSSSGKTTFTKRLGIQLRVNGVKPFQISLDDYFVDRENTPKDKDGNYDFESIEALDLELFNENLRDLLMDKEIELPKFVFKEGKRTWSGGKFKLPQNGIILIEGIHGLNNVLTSSVKSKNKFKIYISALTQLNIDNHNRISTNSVRLIRRIVRDRLFRGYGAEDTIQRWPSIRLGEEKNIFVFQEEADIMFNSTLVYEMCVLKNFALRELEKIEKCSPLYHEASTLASFLKFFEHVNHNSVPENSILREFIGGSCFYNKNYE